MVGHAAAAAKAEETAMAPAQGPAPTAPSATAASAQAAPAAAQAGGGEMPLGKIQVLSGAGAGKELELRKALITLGRPGVQVAVITRRPHGYYITHVEGKHPIVNGDSIGAQAHQLQHLLRYRAGIEGAFQPPGQVSIRDIRQV